MIPVLLADSMISGDWLQGFVVAVFAAFVPIFVAWNKGKSNGKATRLTLGEPVPDVPIIRKYTPPSFSQHMEVVRRVKDLEERAEKMDEKFNRAFAEIRNEISEQYVEILKAGHERETRLSEKLDGIASGFHGRVNELLKFPPTKSR